MERKVVIVAGGTSGIGESVVGRYLEENAIVYAIGKTNRHCKLLEEKYQKENNKPKVVQIDLAKPNEIKPFINEISNAHGLVDYLVNSVGTISKGGILVEDFSDWNNVIENNLHSLFNITKNIIPLLESGNGKSIVNVSSVCSLRPCASLSYSVSKAGTDMFTKVLAKELASKSIRVNAVNPGVVKSNLQKSAGLFSTDIDYEEWIEKMKPLHPLSCVGEPNYVSDAIIFLNSEQAKWITGSILSVDGGRAIA